jgi:p-aminobenzoyl-glutamate transporter AbgT
MTIIDTAPKTIGTAPKTVMQRFLDGIEKVGNMVPHPVVIFLALIGIVIALSAVLSLFGTAVTLERINPDTNAMERTTIELRCGSPERHCGTERLSPIAHTAVIIIVAIALFVWNKLPVVLVAMSTALALWAAHDADGSETCV